MKAEICYGLPFSEYQKADGVSQSELKVIERSPAHFKAGCEPDEEEREDTKAQLLGRIVASISLEPDAKPWWAVRPKGVKGNTKDGIAFKKEAGELQVVSYEDFQHASKMATAILDHPIASRLMEGAAKEVSVFADYETDYGPVRVKCRPDIVSPGNSLPDIKTTLDAREGPFVKSIMTYGYGIQMASYQDIWNTAAPHEQKEVPLLIACEKSPPYLVSVFRLDTVDLGGMSILEHGRRKYRELLNLYAKCLQEGSWPGYPVEIQKPLLPQKYQTRIE